MILKYKAPAPGYRRIFRTIDLWPDIEESYEDMVWEDENDHMLEVPDDVAAVIMKRAPGEFEEVDPLSVSLSDEPDADQSADQDSDSSRENRKKVRTSRDDDLDQD